MHMFSHISGSLFSESISNSDMASRMRVLVLIYLSVSVAHSQGMDPEDEQLIDDYITELMDCRGMPGVILTIARANEVLMTKGYGVANLDTGEPVTVDTVFPVASVSKQFTSILLAKILGEMEGYAYCVFISVSRHSATEANFDGKRLFLLANMWLDVSAYHYKLFFPSVNWNTPVRDIIGEDFYFEDGYRSNNTNFRDLLAHRTGVPRYDHVWTLEGATVDEIVMELVI